MTIGILIFDKLGGTLERVVPLFSADTDPDILAELGESFALRGLFDGGDAQLASLKAADEAVKVKTESVTHPLTSSDSPVGLDVLYDGRPVAIQVKGGIAIIPEPEEHQKVTFAIKRNGGSNTRLAIVLKVNGENTLFRQTFRDIDCNKWVLEPTAKQLIVRGFQKDQKTTESFRVLTKAAAKAREMDYGKDVGLISMTVFREQAPTDLPDDQPPSDEDEDFLAITRGIFPKDKPLNLAALKSQLRGTAGITRSLIVEGDVINSVTNKVEFTPDPTPVMAAVIRYYKP